VALRWHWSPQMVDYPIAIWLQFECIYNIVEYEAFVHGLEVVLEMKIYKLDVYSDLLFIIF
jgi:hypothetical protein